MNDKKVDVTISEQLYDALGRPTIQTVTVKKGGEDEEQSQTLDFDTNFVDNLVPPSDAVYELSGDITQWLDPMRFDAANQPFAYTGSYYEDNPLSRASQATAPNKDFVYNTAAEPPYTHAQQFEYGETSSQVDNVIEQYLGISSNELEKNYRIAVSLLPLNNRDHLNQTQIQDLTGKNIANVSMAPDGAFQLTTKSYAYNPITVGNAPVNLTINKNLPNMYCALIEESERGKFLIIQQYNALGQMIYSESPDSGIQQFFYDDLGRMVFSQSPMQAADGDIQYYDYDALGRLNQVGYFPAIILGRGRSQNLCAESFRRTGGDGVAAEYL